MMIEIMVGRLILFKEVKLGPRARYGPFLHLSRGDLQTINFEFMALCVFCKATRDVNPENENIQKKITLSIEGSCKNSLLNQ